MEVVLDNIRSLHNVGSVFRTADALGVRKIYLCGYTPTPYDRGGFLRPQFSKVALGAEESVPFEKCGQTWRVIDNLKREGNKVYAVELDGRAVRYDSVKLSKKDLERTVLVMGNEVDGLSEAILKRADGILEIPMSGKKESLNVSVAFGVVAYGLRYNL